MTMSSCFSRQTIWSPEKKNDIVSRPFRARICNDDADGTGLFCLEQQDFLSRQDITGHGAPRFRPGKIPFQILTPRISRQYAFGYVFWSPTGNGTAKCR
jgi:hypothetical protein